MSITRTLAAALAIGALVAPAAEAQPADMHASTAQAAQPQKHQDLRSADAQDAVLHPRKSASQPVTVQPQTVAPVLAVATAKGSDIDWASIAVGVAAGLLIMGGLFAVNTRRTRRLHRPRATA